MNGITERALREAGIVIRDEEDLRVLLHTLNEALADYVGQELFRQLGERQKTDLMNCRPDQREKWLEQTLPHYLTIVEQCKQEILKDLADG